MSGRESGDPAGVDLVEDGAGAGLAEGYSSVSTTGPRMPQVFDLM